MTHRASNFTEGVLEMERTVLGIIQVTEIRPAINGILNLNLSSLSWVPPPLLLVFPLTSCST